MKNLLTRNQLNPVIALAFICAVILVVPFPESLSVILTGELASSVGIRGLDLISDGMLLVLAAWTMIAGVRAWLSHPGRRAAVVAGSIGVVAAYALSELVKILFSQPRPCHVWALPGDCPPLGDWSLPSNHATLAFGAAIVISIASRNTLATWFAFGTASIVSIGRIMEGAHYAHDVALGAVLGTAMPAILAALIILLPGSGRWFRRASSPSIS